tara:strand:+ start:7440 stop:9182 length:1743 start_codon:yes stop_codon:yes gene_type:complete
MKRNILILIVFLSAMSLHAQLNENIWFDGLSRSYFARDAIDKSMSDTLSAKNSSNGYNLIDLNTHVNPTKDIEIFAQLRIRNYFGGFFGSGTQISVRQLKAKGIINNKIRFSVGDLFLKQSKFTLYNYDEELSFFESQILKPYRDIIYYENFYIDNRWRLQGIQTDFSFEFDRYIRNLDFDFFIARPNGSSQINETTYTSDLLLSGGSIFSKINKKLLLSLNHINLFEVSSSGTKNISVRNPVYDLSLLYSIDNTNYCLKQKVQTGFSRRYWLHTELENEIEDSTSNETQGMYFEIDNKYIKKDSTLLFNLGYRYVDPDFRSAGSQTRRIDYIEGNNNTIYPFYTNMSVQRQPSLFDLVSDEQLYNQDISSLLMAFNPIYSNILPYGDATPNRSGVYFNAKINNGNKLILVKIKLGFYKEVIGQGALEKRSFRLLKGALKINLHKSLNLKKELSLIVSSESERTIREGDEISSLNLISNHMNISVNAELAKKFFVQASYKQFNANGNEFLIQRDNFGNITYYTPSQIDQKDHMLSIGTMYKFRKNIYANIHYNWWGLKLVDQPSLDYKYNRLLLILSVKL